MLRAGTGGDDLQVDELLKAEVLEEYPGLMMAEVVRLTPSDSSLGASSSFAGPAGGFPTERQ